MSSAQSSHKIPKATNPERFKDCPTCDRSRPWQCIRLDGTCDECEAIAAREKSNPHKLDWHDIIDKRDKLISQSDWVAGIGVEERIGKEEHQKWLNYRNELFDLPQKFETPDAVEWPISPKRKSTRLKKEKNDAKN